MAENKTITVRLIHSSYASKRKDMTGTCHALGLRKINDVSVLPDNPSVRGMIFKVKHLVEVEEN